MAYKVFSNGDALTGGELNTYLMNQSVMVFASTTARDAALTTPTEGMVVWLQNSDKYVYYTGSTWADLISAAGSGNAIINGAFDIWQRGTSFTPAAAGAVVYTADRFAVQRDGTGATVTVSQQTFTPGTAPVSGYESAYYLRFAQSVAGTGGTYNQLFQKIEDVRSFAGQTVTYSFWAKADAATTLQQATIQAFGSGGSGDVVTTGSTQTITTSWARYTYTFTVPSVSGKTIGAGSSMQMGLFLALNTAKTVDIWGVQLEAGSVATSFKRNANSLQGELAACQRYFQRFSANSSNLYAGFGSGHANSSTTISIFVPLRTTMRSTPTFATSGSFQALSGGSTSTTTPTLAADQNGTDSIVLNCTVSGFTAGQGTFLRALNDATANLSMNAEL